MKFLIILIGCIGFLMMDFNDLYPSHIWVRHKLSKLVKAGEGEIYVKDLVWFNFERAHFIGGYDERIYDKQCPHLENGIYPQDGYWGLALVKEGCRDEVVLLGGGKGFSECPTQLRNQEKYIPLKANETEYDKIKIKVKNDEGSWCLVLVQN